MGILNVKGEGVIPLPLPICLKYRPKLSQDCTCDASGTARTVLTVTGPTRGNSSEHLHGGLFTIANAQGRTARHCCTTDLGHSTQRRNLNPNSQPFGKCSRSKPATKGGKQPCRRADKHVPRGGREELHPLRRNRSRICSHQSARRAIFRPYRMPFDERHLLTRPSAPSYSRRVEGSRRNKESGRFRSDASSRCLPPPHHAGWLFPEP